MKKQIKEEELLEKNIQKRQPLQISKAVKVLCKCILLSHLIAIIMIDIFTGITGTAYIYENNPIISTFMADLLAVGMALREYKKACIPCQAKKGLHISIISAILLSYLLGDVMSRLLSFIPPHWMYYEQLDELLQRSLQGNTVILFVSIVVLGPIIEEILFRGILYESLKAKHSKRSAIVISSIIFSIIHLNIIQGINAFFAGIIFCMAYEKNRSILVPILMHTANNFFAFINIFMLWGTGVLEQIAVILIEILLIITNIIQNFLKEDISGKNHCKKKCGRKK